MLILLCLCLPMALLPVLSRTPALLSSLPSLLSGPQAEALLECTGLPPCLCTRLPSELSLGCHLGKSEHLYPALPPQCLTSSRANEAMRWFDGTLSWGTVSSKEVSSTQSKGEVLACLLGPSQGFRDTGRMGWPWIYSTAPWNTYLSWSFGLWRAFILSLAVLFPEDMWNYLETWLVFKLEVEGCHQHLGRPQRCY